MIWVFSCTLEPGRSKLFSDYRALSYMRIVLSYAACLITNILEITDSPSGKTWFFSAISQHEYHCHLKMVFQDCVLHHSFLLPLNYLSSVFFTDAARALAGKHQLGHHSVAFSIRHVPVPDRHETWLWNRFQTELVAPQTQEVMSYTIIFTAEVYVMRICNTRVM